MHTRLFDICHISLTWRLNAKTLHGQNRNDPFQRPTNTEILRAAIRFCLLEVGAAWVLAESPAKMQPISRITRFSNHRIH